MRTPTILGSACALLCSVGVGVSLAGGDRQQRATDAPIDPHTVIVAYRPGSTRTDHLSAERATHTQYVDGLPGGTQELRVSDGQTATAALSRLRADPRVAFAEPNYLLHSADFIPNDPGYGGPNGWERAQWNFIGPSSVNAPAAWSTAVGDHAAGGRGVRIAVIDSGVAYENYGRFRRSPDLSRGSFFDPWDFLNSNRHADDQEGHGTHVTSLIVEETNNHRGVTGLAYGARIMPLRILDANGNGDGASVARGIRYAVGHHAQVINLSVEFDQSVHAADIPDVIAALRYAHDHGVVVVAASGNEGREAVSYPAADQYVISVGATTADGCLADYSNFGEGLALVAPGGGSDAPFSDDAYDRAHCNPAATPREIVQETFERNPSAFRLYGFEGTSFAAPHVTAVVALLLATNRLGSHPTPDEVKARLMATARNIGPPGYNRRYGAGLLDAAAAIAP